MSSVASHAKWGPLGGGTGANLAPSVNLVAPKMSSRGAIRRSFFNLVACALRTSHQPVLSPLVIKKKKSIQLVSLEIYCTHVRRPLAVRHAHLMTPVCRIPPASRPGALASHTPDPCAGRALPITSAWTRERPPKGVALLPEITFSTGQRLGLTYLLHQRHSPPRPSRLRCHGSQCRIRA